MKKGPFKMKGSPMQRNFGIGSPLHDKTKFVNLSSSQSAKKWTKDDIGKTKYDPTEELIQKEIDTRLKKSFRSREAIEKDVRDARIIKT
jgi:hypothetical protein